MSTTTRVLVTALLGTLPVLHAREDPGDWPGWRGPDRDGKVGGTAWPDNLSENHLRKLWSVTLGPSYSGPVVSSRAVFVTETLEREREVVRALDRATGEELWKSSWEGSISVPFFAASNGSWIRATPFHDGERLYVAGMRDVLVCLDATTGSTVWHVDFPQKLDAPVPPFGFVSSPLVTSDHVYAQAGGCFVKLDKLTGEIAWRALADGGGMYGSAFSSPAMARLHGESQLVVQTRSVLAGVSPESGDTLWSREIPAHRGMNILTPTVVGNRIFTSSYGGGSRLVVVEHDGRESFDAREAWSDTAQGYMSSPVVIGDHVYVHLRNQRMTCFDLSTGERTWTTSQRFGKYVSLVCQGERILGLSEQGTLYLFQATPKKLETLDAREVSDEPTWAHVAIAGSRIFVRSLNAISAWEWKDGESPPSDQP